MVSEPTPIDVADDVDVEEPTNVVIELVPVVLELKCEPRIMKPGDPNARNRNAATTTIGMANLSLREDLLNLNRRITLPSRLHENVMLLNII